MTDLDIHSLQAEEKKLEARIKIIRVAIKNLRDLCDHDFARSGHDSHHSYQRCERCGHEEIAP